MKKSGEAARDREVTRAIHRLFWKANFADWPSFAVNYLTRIPAMVLYNVLIPLVIAYGIEAIVTRQFSAVNRYALVILALAIGYAILWGIGGWYISRNGKIGGSYVERTVFSNYLNKDYDFYSNAFFGSLGAQAMRLRDAYLEYARIVTLDGIKQASIIISSIVIIGLQSPLLAIITIIAMIFILSFTLLTARWRLKYRRLVGEANSELAGVIGDALSHGPTVKSFASEAREEKRLDKTLLRWGNIQELSWRTSIPADTGRMILAALGICTLLIMTARMYQNGTISIAIVALVQLYVIRLIGVTQDIAEALKSYENAMGGAYQPVKTMLIQPTVADKPDPRKLPKNAKPEINFKDVSFHYNDAKHKAEAVSTFNLHVRPGEKIGLVGYSGSGKTTLTKLLLRFMDISRGSITIGGIDIRELSQADLRSHIAYVPQEPLLFHRTIAENIAYGKPTASKRQVQQAATMAYVDEFAKELPNSYDTLVGERGVKLSGGQRQRVAIARALLKDAPILVLDEATSALDSRSEKYIQQALWKLMKDRTALVIAHRLSTIQSMDRIVVMDKGRIVQIGTHNELLQDSQGVYAALWAHQSGGYVGLPTTEDSNI
ncbi:MAG TPA: ABC transporter ATP-binding protein [Candidatus Saccharimonadales bacterium]|nr:ABC transporter ATP-binding protein [Candidatus Saccharimonadales bacterium]